MAAPETKGRSIKWTEAVSAAAAIVAIAISLRSCSLSVASHDAAGTAQAYNLTQDARGLATDVEVKHYVARSPDLRAAEDTSWLNPLELHPNLVETGYWSAQSRQYNANAKKGYLFIIIIDQGPGRVQQMQISNIVWTPNKGSNKPAGIDVANTLGILQPQHFYALLIDVLDAPNATDPWKRTNFDLRNVHFRSVSLDVSATDELGNTNHQTVGMGDALQASISTPPPLMSIPQP